MATNTPSPISRSTSTTITTAMAMRAPIERAELCLSVVGDDVEIGSSVEMKRITLIINFVYACMRVHAHTYH